MSYKKVVKISHILFEQEKGRERFGAVNMFFKHYINQYVKEVKRQTLD